MIASLTCCRHAHRAVAHARIARKTRPNASTAADSPRSSIRAKRTLATSLLDGAVKSDTFPGTAAPATARARSPSRRTRGAFASGSAPARRSGARRSPFPNRAASSCRGSSGGAEAGDPREVLRHELAHLALHEYLGDLPPRWFDEGYASYSAREWRRDDVLAANVALALRGDADASTSSTPISAPVRRRRRTRMRSPIARWSSWPRWIPSAGSRRSSRTGRRSVARSGGARDVRHDAVRLREAVAAANATALRCARAGRAT